MGDSYREELKKRKTSSGFQGTRTATGKTEKAIRKEAIRRQHLRQPHRRHSQALPAQVRMF